MRPATFIAGNMSSVNTPRRLYVSFNEARDFHRGKYCRQRIGQREHKASMRPATFIAGNKHTACGVDRGLNARFNEARDFHRGKSTRSSFSRGWETALQ